MPFARGTKLGPYELIAELGAGGMGVVYRARDTRLGRDVAVKVLGEAYSQDSKLAKRFEQEARSTSALSHPNIVSVFDFGSENGQYYIVTELLHGKTLRQVLQDGPIAVRMGLSYAMQAASGLAAAHAQNIVHRDLKPENLFVCDDGRVKILDFGIAKRDTVGPAPEDEQTVTNITEPGMVVGTARYMSPEQVRAQAVDARSDIFSLGAVMYEVFGGGRAFHGETKVETMTAILREDPKPLTEANPAVPQALASLVHRCLEKNPGERFQSARDLGFALEALTGTRPEPAVVSPPVTRRRVLPWIGGAGIAAAAAAGGFLAGRSGRAARTGEFRRMTFRRGYVTSARFSSDGQTIIYSAAWDGDRVKLYSGRADRPEYRALDLPPGYILAISSKSEMAILSGGNPQTPMERIGTLSIAPLAGGSPRELVKGVQAADWSPAGDELAIVYLDRTSRLEYPRGKLLYESRDGKVADPRVSPDGKLVAFIDQPQSGNDAGAVAVIDRAGKRRKLSRDFRSCQGIAWSPGGDEILVTAAAGPGGRQLWSVSLSGKERALAGEAERMTLMDSSHAGQLLLTHELYRVGISARPGREQQERDYSWLDLGQVFDITADGKAIAFAEGGAAVGGKQTVYLRRFDGTSPVQLGSGAFPAMSPDGQWLASLGGQQEGAISLYPVGAGESRVLPTGPLKDVNYFRWLRDSKRLVLQGTENGKRRVYVQSIDAGQPQAIGPAGLGLCSASLTPDGAHCVACRRGQTALVPVDGGEAKAFPTVPPGHELLAFAPDGRTAYIQNLATVPAEVLQMDVATGKMSPWRKFQPPNSAGVTTIAPILLSRDLESYAYSYESLVSDLYLMSGAV